MEWLVDGLEWEMLEGFDALSYLSSATSKLMPSFGGWFLGLLAVSHLLTKKPTPG